MYRKLKIAAGLVGGFLVLRGLVKSGIDVLEIVHDPRVAGPPTD